MGRSIVYCDKCGTLLREEDFNQGKAVVADNRNFCSACKPAGSSPSLPQPPSAKKASSSRIPKQAPPEYISSSRLPKQPQHQSRPIPAQAPPPPAAEGASSNARVIGIVIAGLVLGGAALATMFSGGTKESRKAEEPPAAAPLVVPPGAPNVEKLNPEERRREEAARAACVKAYEVLTTRPKDLAAQWRAFEAAVAASQGSSYASDASTQLAKVRRRFEEERSGVEARSQEALAKEQFKPALDVWEGELGRFDVPEWTRPLHDRIAELKSDFERRLGVMRDAAVEARKRGDEGEAKRIRARVAGWGLSGYAEQIDQALAGVVPDKRDPAPPAGSPAALDAYRSKWKELLAPAFGRDLSELLRGMEKLAAATKDEAAKEAAEDLENLKLASTVYQESAALLPKLARGQKIPIAYWDPSGALARIEDAVLKIDGQRVEMKQGDGSVVIPFGEVAALTLAELFKGRPARKDSDNRAAALACLLDGDPEGAQRFQKIGDKYVEAAKELCARRSRDDKEGAARILFYEAERDYFDYGETGKALAKYKSLLADHAGTAFVKRNRAAIAARAETGLKDFLFASGDLIVTPAFKLGKYGKVETAWVSQQDVEPAKLKDNYVQIEFFGTPDAEYRCWILAGGCCQEVLTFHVQATELLAPDPEKPKEKVAAEPGGAVTLLVKSTNSSLKKLHAQHNGPKNPERFDWVQAGVFKFPTPGTKKIRILTGNKGFAVANAAVLSTRPGPPRDLEFKELEKWRAETPGALLKQGGVVTGCILREVFRNIDGGEVAQLTAAASFKEDRPDERVMITEFAGPVDIGDSYGTRIRGYVHPPVNGAYVFWIATDDTGELWISTDEDPAHKRKIASCPSYASPKEYGKFPEQKSEPIELKAGRRYYIEALHKEGGGGDHVSVKWQPPNGPEEAPIPGSRLSPFVPVKK
jgi:hypothetical protein